MNRTRIGVAAFLLIFAGLAFWNGATASRQEDTSEVLCGHVCAHRMCLLKGAPVSLDQVLAQMPASNGEHSFMDLSVYLKSERIPTEGRRCSVEELDDTCFPCIASLKNPDHFVLLLKKDGPDIHLFNFNGRRAIVPIRTLEERWGSAILTVGPRTSLDKPSTAPSIEMSSLYSDIGIVPAHGRPVQSRFEIRNAGTDVLVISEIMKSCKCVEAMINAPELSPGESTELFLSYKSDANFGFFEQSVFLTTNDPEHPVVEIMTAGVTGNHVIVRPTVLRLAVDLSSGELESDYIFLETPEHFSTFEILSIAASNVRLKTQEVAWNATLQAECLRRVGMDLPLSSDVDFSSRNFRAIRVSAADDVQDSFVAEVSVRTNIHNFEELSVPVFVDAARIRTFPSIVQFTVDDQADPGTVSARLSIAGPVKGCELIRSARGGPLPTSISLQTSRDPVHNVMSLRLTGDLADVEQLHGQDIEFEVELANGRTKIQLPISYPPKG
jgi:hypothetical protein